jgi:hypothetical protein
MPQFGNVITPKEMNELVSYLETRTEKGTGPVQAAQGSGAP